MRIVGRVALALLAGIPGLLSAQTKTLALDSASGLTLYNVVAAPVVFKGVKALELAASEPETERLAAARGRGRIRTGPGPAAGEAGRKDHLAVIDGVEFSSGTIEVDLAGAPHSGARGGARGFVGVAFRVQPDRKTYDCFYLRPTNGRADDQERRNHSAQYISHPAYPWFRLRREAPSKYEAYVDIVPDEWIHVRMEVDGDQARLYVNRNQQPTLIVNDVKSGASARGAVALWFEGSTIAHFANLKITPR